MSAKRPHILVFGGINMDLVVRVPVIPRPGETVTGTTFATFPGGKGANQAVALARMGAQVTMIGQVGADDFGNTMLETLRSEGIDTTYVQTDPQRATGVALITVEDSGQNNISVASGANTATTAADVRAALSAVASFDLLVMPLDTPMDVVLAAAQLAKERGARVVLNPAPAQKLPEALLRCVDVMVPNEFEAASLTGIAVDNEPQARQAAEILHGWTGGHVVVTLGARGALALDAAQPQQAMLIPAHPVTALDTTAAGDAFVGGLAVGLGEGRPLADAARLGNAAGALAVTRAGAQPSLPRREEVEKLIESANLR